MNSNNKESRREFLIKTARLLGASACTIAALSASGCENFVEKSGPSEGIVVKFDISDEENLRDRIGWGVLKSFPGVNYGIEVILVRLSEEEFVCFSSMCTHAHCSGEKMSMPMGNYDGFRVISCECHGSQFDPFQNGKPIDGPAEKPLKQFDTEFDKETNILSIYF